MAGSGAEAEQNNSARTMTDLPELEVAFERLKAGNRISQNFYDPNGVSVIAKVKLITHSE